MGISLEENTSDSVTVHTGNDTVGLPNRAPTMIGHDDETHYGELKRNHPHYAGRVAGMSLTEQERENVAYALGKAMLFNEQGKEWKTWGDHLYTAQVVASALVPVLVGILSTFKDDVTFTVLQITAIVFSVVGTVCKAIEDVYNFRQRGQIRIQYSHNMNGLFNEFNALSGPVFDPEYVVPGCEDAKLTTTIPDLTPIPLPVLKAHIVELEKRAGQKRDEAKTHSGANFKRFYAHFAKLHTEAREVAFVGQTAAGASGSVK